jgi:hypothetical protein
MLSVILSLVPTASPFLMLLRIGIRPRPPLWQIARSVVLVAAMMVIAVW